MTLRELCNLVRGKKANGIIVKSQLLARHEGIVTRLDTTMGNGTIEVSVKVYESGYVLYEEDDKHTVFHLDDLKDKNWYYEGAATDKETRRANTVKNDVIMSEDWSVGLIMEGNDRIMHNREKTETDYVEFSYSGLAEDVPELAVEFNFIKEMEDEAMRENMQEVFRTLREAMSPEQWGAYVLIKAYGKRQREAAELLGMSQQAVSKNYLKACKVVVNFGEQLKKDFYKK